MFFFFKQYVESLVPWWSVRASSRATVGRHASSLVRRARFCCATIACVAWWTDVWSGPSCSKVIENVFLIMKRVLTIRYIPRDFENVFFNFSLLSHFSEIFGPWSWDCERTGQSSWRPTISMKRSCLAIRLLSCTR